jgi:hypothetical protein
MKDPNDEKCPGINLIKKTACGAVDSGTLATPHLGDVAST